MIDTDQIPSYQIAELRSPSELQKDIELVRFERYFVDIDHLHHPHRHDFYMLMFIQDGGGSQNIDFKTYELQANRQFFMSPGQIHSWGNIENAKGYVLMFTRSFASMTLHHPDLNKFLFFNTTQYPPFTDLEEHSATQIRELMELMMTEYDTGASYRETILRSYLNILLHTLARFYKGLRSGWENQGGVQIIRKFENLINENYKTHRSAKDYAEILNLTPNYLNALCKKITGHSSGELIRERIMLEAKRLLVHTNQSVSEIAFYLRFEDNSYFCRFFKKYSGHSPAEFRETHKFKSGA